MISSGNAAPMPQEPVGAASFNVEHWVEAFRIVADYYGLPMSSQAATLSGLWDGSEDEQQRLSNLARRMGLRLRAADLASFSLSGSGWRLPLVLGLNNGQILVMRALDGKGGARCLLIGDAGLETTLPVEAIEAGVLRVVILRPAQNAPDPRVDAYIAPFDEHWLRKIVLRDLRARLRILMDEQCAGAAGCPWRCGSWPRTHRGAARSPARGGAIWSPSQRFSRRPIGAAAP